MNTARSNAGWELLWWIAILAIAGGLVLLLLTSPLQGAAPGMIEPRADATAPAAPRMLEPLEVAWKRAVDDFRCGEADIARQELAIALDEAGLGGPTVPGNLPLTVWRILLDHATGQWDRAIAAWHHVVLPPRSDVWRHVALASAYLETGQLEAAAETINAGWELDSQHPLLHYYRGLLTLEQAARGVDFYDAVESGPTRLAAHRRPAVTPTSSSMDRIVASMQLERAIEHAGAVVRHEPLVPMQSAHESWLIPTVEDLLAAIGADRFEGDAHHVLGDLFLQRGHAELAEEHFDSATGAGVRVIFGYGELATYYESQLRSLDAARAFAKELRSSPGHGSAGWRMLGNLSRAMWSW